MDALIQVLISIEKTLSWYLVNVWPPMNEWRCWQCTENGIHYFTTILPQIAAVESNSDVHSSEVSKKWSFVLVFTSLFLVRWLSLYSQLFVKGSKNCNEITYNLWLLITSLIVIMKMYSPLSKESLPFTLLTSGQDSHKTHSI